MEFFSGSELVKHNLPVTPFWIHPIVPRTGIVLLYGKFGSYKTPLSVHLAYCLATGQPFLGMNCSEPTRVLYIEGDTPMPGIWPRLQKMNPDTPMLDFAFVYPGFNAVAPKQGERNAEVCHQLYEKHKANNYGLVVIDSLRTSHLLNDKDSEVPSMVYGSLSTLFPNACIFLIHHDRKSRIPDGGGSRYRRQSDPDEELDNESFSGSQAWIDRATTSLKILKGYSKEREWITLRQTKSQVGQVMDPLPVHVKDGCLFSLTPYISDLDITQCLPLIGTFKNKRDLDEKLAAFWNIPVKLMTVRRQEYEATVGPIK